MTAGLNVPRGQLPLAVGRIGAQLANVRKLPQVLAHSSIRDRTAPLHPTVARS